jgi:hypothetical protein
MDSYLLVGPVEAGVLHFAERMLDVILCTVSADDLLVAPIVVVCEKDRLAQHCPAQVTIS